MTLKIHESIIILKKVGVGGRRSKVEKRRVERKLFFTEICEKVHVKDMIKSENHHFVTIGVIMIQGKIMNEW